MNPSHDPFYVLGLQPGASPAEIRAAYRRLVKLYHPDHDQSLDAEVKYKEISVAYYTLRDQCFASEKSAESANHRDPSNRATWTSRDWKTEQTTEVSENWKGGYDIDLDELLNGTKSTVRLPLSLKNLPTITISALLAVMPETLLMIFMVSLFILRETITVSGYNELRALMLLPYSGMVIWYCAISWFFYIFFRYYFWPLYWSFLLRFVVGLVYGAILIILMASFYTVPKEHLIFAGFGAAVFAWYLLFCAGDG